MGNLIKVGDLVTRPSYGGDLVFQVVHIDEANGVALLRAHALRLMADAPLSDLVVYSGGSAEGSGRLRQMRNR